MIDNILVITGGMGTGKSTILSLFEKNGFIVVNSDKEVVSLFSKDYENYVSLAQDFDNWLGTNFSQQQEIDKKKLRTYLENTPNGFPKSLEIVKPHIIARLLNIAKEYNNQKIVFEIPLLFEANMESFYKNILVVTAPMDIRINRIQSRQNHLSIAQIKQTIDSQIPQEEKIKKATFTIDNSGTLEELESNFNFMLPKFLDIYKKNKLKFNS